MPLNVGGEKVYTEEEYRRRYQQGFVDGGGTKPTDGFSRDDLKKAFDEGKKGSDNLISSLSRTAFKKGVQAGASDRQAETLKQMREESKIVTEERCKTARTLGYEKGCATSHSDRFEEGKAAGHKEAQEAIKKESATISKQAIDDYVRSGFSNPTSQNRFARWIGNIPVSTSFYKKMPSVAGNKLPAPLRLSHYRIAPIRVGSRLLFFSAIPTVLASYLLLKKQAIPVITPEQKPVIETKVRDPREKEKVLNQDEYGEIESQYKSHEKVVEACNQLRSITPMMLGIEKFSPENTLKLTEGLEKCQQSRDFHEEMKRMTSLRKAFEQKSKLYGLRNGGGYQDNQECWKIEGDCESGIYEEINTLNKQLIKDAALQQSTSKKG